jgi:hypothetical protein
MRVRTEKVKQYNSTRKVLLFVDDKCLCILLSEAMASECIQYLYGYDADINDNKIKKILDQYRLPSVNKSTVKLEKKKEKAIKKFSEVN